MSTWGQRLSSLSGRWSPFTRSPTTENGTAQVRDADFSYITADDLKNGEYDRNSGPPRETDVLIVKNKRNAYQIHFPAYSIDRGELTVKEVREQTAKKTGSDVKRIRLLHRGKQLKDDSRTCREEGLKEGAEVMCVTSDGAIEAPSSSSSSDEGEGAEGADTPKRKRNRNKNKKKRGKKRGDAQDPDSLAVPGGAGSGSSRTASPKPPATPATPLDKLNELGQKLQSLMPQCRDYMAHPPKDKKERDFEYKKLSETILAQIVLKLDAVETDEADARARRKELVKEAQAVLNDLDAAKGS